MTFDSSLRVSRAKEPQVMGGYRPKEWFTREIRVKESEDDILREDLLS